MILVGSLQVNAKGKKDKKTDRDEQCEAIAKLECERFSKYFSEDDWKNKEKAKCEQNASEQCGDGYPDMN